MEKKKKQGRGKEEKNTPRKMITKREKEAGKRVAAEKSGIEKKEERRGEGERMVEKQGMEIVQEVIVPSQNVPEEVVPQILQEGVVEEEEVIRSKFEDEEIRRTYQITYQSRFKAVLSLRKKKQLGDSIEKKKKENEGEQLEVVNVQLEPVERVITAQEQERRKKRGGQQQEEEEGGGEQRLEQEWRDGLIMRLCENCSGEEKGVQSLIVWWGLCVWRGYTVHYKDLPDLEAADLYNHLISSQGRRFDSQGNPDSWWIMEVPISYLYFSYFTEISILSLKYPSLIPLQCKEFTRQFPSVFGFKSLLRNNKGVVNHVQHKIQQSGEKTVHGNVKRSTLYYLILPPLHQARCDFITRYPDRRLTITQESSALQMEKSSGVKQVRGMREYFAWCPSPRPFTPFPFQYSLLTWARSQCDTNPSSILKSSSATNTSLCRQITHFTQNLPSRNSLQDHTLPEPTIYSSSLPTMTPPILPLLQGTEEERRREEGEEWMMASSQFTSGEQEMMEHTQSQEEQIQAMLEQFIAHHGTFFDPSLSMAENEEMRMDSFFSQDTFLTTSSITSTATTPQEEDTPFSFS